MSVMETSITVFNASHTMVDDIMMVEQGWWEWGSDVAICIALLALFVFPSMNLDSTVYEWCCSHLERIRARYDQQITDARPFSNPQTERDFLDLMKRQYDSDMSRFRLRLRRIERVIFVAETVIFVAETVLSLISIGVPFLWDFTGRRTAWASMGCIGGAGYVLRQIWTGLSVIP